jgi:XTP/dITP diphosphohydrolase
VLSGRRSIFLGIMTILLASQNAHKKLEIAQILKDHTILLPRDRGYDFELEETGETFLENALAKARHLNNIAGTPVMADDSGLCVPALDGAPGVYSARYGAREGGNDLTDVDRNELLLKNMRGITDRRAYFVCSMVLLFDENRFYVAQETVNGEITLSPQGDQGFGYDPLFFLPNLAKTAAQLAAKEKNAISHRGKATVALARLITVD